MRRIALILTTLAAGAAGLSSVAGADDSHTYKLEFYNAFGLVEGSEVKVAGVQAGVVKVLDVNDAKRALLTVELTGPLSALGTETTCASQPQSLIAEYFITCDPKGPPMEEGATIPASRNRITVQNDLAANTLREPFKRRLQLIFNEFGTALAGNPENLNEAIRLGAPALTDLKKALDALGDQNEIIRDLTSDADLIVAKLVERRDDVINFIQEARDAAAISVQRREDLRRNFDLLDDFLAQLAPTMNRLGEVARQQTPLLSDLNASAPRLNKLSVLLPDFNAATADSLVALGDAGEVGARALTKGVDEIEALRDAGENASTTSDLLADLFEDLSDPRRIVETDARAARTCDDPTQTCWASGREAPTGYTGLEGLLNYVYVQTLALNQYDHIGHLLHFSLFDVGIGPLGSPCGGYNAHRSYPNVDNTGETHELSGADPAHRCVSVLGPNQPQITPGDPLPSPRYDQSVCPEGSNDLALCNPALPEGARAGRPSNEPAVPQLPPTTLPLGPDNLPQGLEELLGLPADGSLPQNLEKRLRRNADADPRDNRRAALDLLDFLFGF